MPSSKKINCFGWYAQTTSNAGNSRSALECRGRGLDKTASGFGVTPHNETYKGVTRALRARLGVSGGAFGVPGVVLGVHAGRYNQQAAGPPGRNSQVAHCRSKKRLPCRIRGPWLVFPCYFELGNAKQKKKKEQKSSSFPRASGLRVW